MAKLERKKFKVFAENAPLDEMGQFGSAVATTKKNTKDIEEIQELEAWQQGWGSAVISNKNYPPMEEMNGALNVMSYQTAYTLQEGIPEWNKDTVYYIGSIVKTLVDNKVVLYQSLKNENIGNVLDNGEYWEELKLGGSGHSLFDIVQKDHKLSFEESKGFAELGSYVYKTGVSGSRYGYPDFYNECINQKDLGVSTETTLGENVVTMYVNANGHTFYDIEDKDAVDAFYDKYGVAWFYGVDTVNERINIPRNDYFFQSGNSTDVGKFVEAGLPNILATWNSATESANTGIYNGDSGAVTTTQNLSYAIELPGSPGGGCVKRTFNASNSNSIYGNSDTVQPPAVKQIYYMVVGNTETQSATTDVVDITTSENDTLPLFYNFYSSEDMTTTGAYVNASLGSWLSGNVYTTAYNELVKKLGIDNVKANTDEYTDYDFVVNQNDMTFRLPLKNGQEIMFATGVKGNGMTLGLTNGSSYAGLAASANSTDRQLFAPIQSYGTSAGSSLGSTFILNSTLGVTTDSSKSGIELDTENITIPDGWNLYYKVSNTVQNLELLDVAGVMSTLNTKTDITQAANASMPSGRYVDLTLAASNSDYTAPADGYATIQKIASATGQHLGIYSQHVDGKSLLTQVISSGSNQSSSLYLPVAKGDTFKVTYGFGGTTLWFRFYYAQGAK